MTPSDDRFKADSLSIIELFQSTTYEIPAFQRDYSWTKEQCADLWSDLQDLMDGESSSHFLGPMVVLRQGENSRKNYLVIDGQQRLTTIQMIISLIRDHWVQLSPGFRETPAGPKPFEDTCKSLLNSGPPNYEATFVPNWHIREIFFDYIQRELSDASRKKITKLDDVKSGLEYSEELFKAYMFFREKIINLSQEKTSHLETNLLYNVYVLRIDAIKIDNAFILFDTLNNRGLDLTQGDLVKNLIFQLNKEPASANLSPAMMNILSKWDGIVEKVTHKKLDTFLRYFLLLQVKKKFQRASITKVIEAEYGSKDGINKFLEELSIYADLYSLIERTENFEGPHKNELNYIFDDLNDLNQATQAVFLLAALKRFGDRQKKDSFVRLSTACRAAEILSFRWLVTGKNAQELEDVWRKAALILLSSGKSDQDALEAAISELKSHLPSDKEFKSEFTNRAFKASKFARYVLKKIENSKLDNTVWVLAGSNKLDVEHVAPKSPDETHNWRLSMDGNISYRNIIYRIGNQTLLSKSLNRSARNNEYSWKRDYYIEHTGQLTTLTLDLLKNKSWDQAAVLRRSEKLANDAIGIWNWASVSKELRVSSIAPTKQAKTKGAAKKRTKKAAARNKPATRKKAVAKKKPATRKKVTKRGTRKGIKA